MPQKQHVMHGRDHEHGAADPIHIAWEDVGGGGGGGSGIQFEASPQAGGWLYVETTDRTAGAGAPNGWGLELYDTSHFMKIGNYADTRIEIINYGVEIFAGDYTGNDGIMVFHSIDAYGDNTIDMGAGAGRIELTSRGPDGITLNTNDTGPIHLNCSTTGNPRLKISNLPTTNPGGSGAVWNDGGTLKIT